MTSVKRELVKQTELFRWVQKCIRGQSMSWQYCMWWGWDFWGIVISLLHPGLCFVILQLTEIQIQWQVFSRRVTLKHIVEKGQREFQHLSNPTICPARRSRGSWQRMDLFAYSLTFQEMIQIIYSISTTMHFIDQNRNYDAATQDPKTSSITTRRHKILESISCEEKSSFHNVTGIHFSSLLKFCIHESAHSLSYLIV